MNDKVEILVRHAIDGDIDFITSSWLNSFRDGYFNSTVSNRVYFNQHHKILERLLPEATVLVACNSEKPQQIFGWMCFQVVDRVMIFHYVYVKNLMRTQGIAQRLFDYVVNNDSLDVAKNVVMTTHQTQKSKSFIKGEKGGRSYEDRHPDRPIQWMYNPYALFYQLPEGWEQE